MTKSDSTVLPVTRGLYIGVTGDVVVTMASGSSGGGGGSSGIS